MMAARALDPYTETEKMLNRWGDACRRNSESVGMPTLSTIAQIIAHVQREERKRKDVRKRALRKKHREQRKKKEPVDAKEAAEVKGFVEPELTAKGKDTRSLQRISLQLTGEAARVDAAIRRLEKWMQATIQRSYLYRQPDENACSDLRVPKEVYRLWRIRAVEVLAERLEVAKR